MKPHLHKVLRLYPDDVLGVYTDNPAFVFFADEDNYDRYLNDFDFDYFGTAVKKSPFYMAPPEPGVWHVVVEQSDPALTINVRLAVVRREEM